MWVWVCGRLAAAGTVALVDVSDAVPGVVGAEPPIAGDGLQGVAWLDYDGDDDLDLFHTNGPGLPALLFRNDGGGAFTEAAAEAGVAITTGGSGVLAADLDGDGATDLLVLGDGSYYRLAVSPNVLLRNEGDGTFVDVTVAAGLAALAGGTHVAATAADIDLDGDLDVFIAAPGSLVYRRQDPDVLLRNDGGRFVNVAAEAGVAGPNASCAASFVHADDDDAIDLFVASCAEINYVANPLLLFSGAGDGTFVDTHVERKIWATGWWMAATTGDLDGDDRLDLFSTNLGPPRGAPNALYVAQPDGTYAERAVDAGLDGYGFGWGATAVDLDDDGWTDLYYAGSPAIPAHLDESAPGYALRNRGDATFELVPQPFDLSDRPTTGLAAADYDDDGRVDLAIASARRPDTFAASSPILLHNVGTTGRGLTVRLRGDLPNADAIGARIRATLPDGRTLRRDVIAGSSFASTESPWPTFGVGEAAEVTMVVTWPDGVVEDFGAVAVEPRIELVRGAGVTDTGEATLPRPALDPAPRTGCGCDGAGSARAPLALLLAVLLVACRRGPTGAPAVGGLRATTAWSEHVPNVALVRWTAPAGASSWVEFGLDDLDRSTPTVAGADVDLPLLGLKPGRTYSWRAVSAVGETRHESALATLEVPPAPADLPRLVIDLQEEGAETPGGFLVAPTTSELIAATADTWIVIWDGDGDPVWWQHLERGHASISPSFGATPGTLLYDDYDMTDSWYRATARRVHLDGSAQLDVALLGGTHVALEPEPDVFAWGARELREGTVPDTWITADRVLEAPLAGVDAPAEVVDLYDDLYGGTYPIPCTHPLLPLTEEDKYPVFEWSHLNSLVHLPERDAYLVHLRWVDTTMLVDRSTGEVLWRLGGPLGDFTDPDGQPLWVDAESASLSHAHLSHAWDGGFVAFDNGTHRDPPVSSVVEVVIDEATRVATEVFRWEDPAGRYVWALGDARKLPGGHTLASWSTFGELNEIDPDGRERWRAHTDPPRSVGRLAWTADLYAQ